MTYFFLTSKVLKWYEYVDSGDWMFHNVGQIEDLWISIDSEDLARKEMFGISAFDEHVGLQPVTLELMVKL